MRDAVYQSTQDISRSVLKNGRTDEPGSLAPGSNAEYGTYSNALRRSMTLGERRMSDSKALKPGIIAGRIFLPELESMDV